MKYASIKHLVCALVAALVFPTAALAATPVAVWDGNFNVVQPGYTLSLNGNQLSSDNSTITINQSVGVTVDFAKGFTSAMTVMFKYSDLSFDAQKTIATSYCNGGDENRTGVYLASGGTANGIWNTANWNNPDATLSESSGVLAFYYPKSTGTGLYYISSSGTKTQIYFNSSLKGSNDAAINGCAIGGERAKSGATLLSAATGMKISGIAIFNSALSDVEMTSYLWPSEEASATYTLSLDGTPTNWSDGSWKIGTNPRPAPVSGYAKIVFSNTTTLTIDTTVALNQLVLEGAADAVLTLVAGSGGSLVAYDSVQIKGGVLKQGSASVLGATPTLSIENGGTFDMNGLSINAATAVHLAGAGAGSWPWALTSSTGAGGAILGGLYLSDDATIGGAYELKVGQTQAGYQCYLQGHTLTKIGAGAFTGTNMNTPGNGTIDVHGGAMSVNQWNNLNNQGGNTTVILRGGTSLANSTDRDVPMGTLNLLGGTLSTPRAFKVNSLLTGSGETANLAFADGAAASLTGDLTVTGTLTLDGAMSFSKDENAANDVVVTASGTMSSSGAISVGSGVTLNLGINRPTGEITVANDGILVVQMQNASDVIELSTSSQPANVVLYDENGEIANARITYSNGKLTIKPLVPTLSANGTTAFDNAANWINSTMPDANGNAIIELSGDAEITVASNYTLGEVTITGNGQVSFSGNGSVTAANIYLKNGATLSRNAKVSATTGINIDSGTVLKLYGVTENAVISGAGAVETYGNVTMAAPNTFTGGITAKTGTLSTTTASGFGKDNSGSEYSALSRIMVKDGACVDLNNTKDHCFALTIEGKGVLQANGTYSGAVKNTGVAMDHNSRQTASLTLTADAVVDVSSGWGLVQSGHKEAYLALNGHKLTFRGSGTVPMINVNASNSSGTIVLDGANLQLSNAASTLTGVNIVAKGCSSINIAVAPSALGSLSIEPAASSGTTASAWNLPEGLVPVVKTENVDFSGLSDGAVVTLFTAPSALSSETISVQASTRFTNAIISGKNVTATFHAGLPSCFLHYGFEGNVDAASDSTTSFMVSGEDDDRTFTGAMNGQAIKVHTDYTPYWGSYQNGTSPIHAGGLTVTAVARLCETNIVLWGLGNSYNDHCIGIAALSTNSVAVVAKNGSSSAETLLTLTTSEDLTSGWHFFALVASEHGTTLYVDRQSASCDKGFHAGMGTQGQLGSFYNGTIVAKKVGNDGYWLDDWRVYDAALTRGEIKSLRKKLFNEFFRLILR